MKERIKEIRKNASMTQKDFADSLNLSKSTIEGYEYGRLNVPDRVIDDICRVYSVNEEWLRNGSGDMYVDMTRNEKILQFANQVMADQPESFRAKLVEALVDLTEDDWEELARIAKKLCK